VGSFEKEGAQNNNETYQFSGIVPPFVMFKPFSCHIHP
jgi:hypothetical protein